MTPDRTYYMEGLLRQANAAYARTYLGLGASDVVTFGYVKNTTPLWQDVRTPFASMRAGAASATPQIWLGTVRAYRFRQGTGDDLEYEIQVPHGLNEADVYGVRLHVHWYSAAATTPNTVQWNVEVATANIDGQFPAGTTVYSNTGLTTLARQHVITSLHTFTGFHDSALIVGRIYRSGVGDTYGGDVFGLSLDAHYVVQESGSLDEFGD